MKQLRCYVKLYYKNIYNIGVISILLLFWCNLSSAKIAITSFEERVNLAHLILICKVIDIERKIIGQDIVVMETIKLIKGNLNEKYIRVKYGDFLFKDNTQKNRFTIGKTYILFLIIEDEQLQILGGFQGYYPVTSDGLVCKSYEEKPLLNEFIDTIINIIKLQKPK